MTRLSSALSLAAMAVIGALAMPADASGPADDWDAYKRRFVAAEGRVVDTGNGMVSHSEGQGYGMLLAAAFDDRETFGRLWRWTRDNLQIRDDRLLAWRWDPARPDDPVADTNSATDGDLLVAWALARAGARWHDPALTAEAAALAGNLRRAAIRTVAGHVVLLPGPAGFEHEGRTVLNLSYWVFPAFDSLAAVDPSPAWDELERSGLTLLADARFGSWRLPTDWIEIAADGTVGPAADFAPLFGYNAVRIPLHLAWAGYDDPWYLEPFLDFWTVDGRIVPHATVNVTTGALSPESGSAGFRAIAALGASVVAGNPCDGAIPGLSGTDDYYAASLVLLSQLACRERD